MADLPDGPVADGAQRSSSSSSPGGPQPRARASGSQPERGRAAHVEHGDQQAELSGSKNNETTFITKWIRYLRGQETSSGQYGSDARRQAESTRVPDEELNALQSFCAVKINLIQHRANSKEKKSSGRQKPQLRLEAGASEGDALTCTVPDELVNRIYLKNMRTAPKQGATAKQHISWRCLHCNRKRAELAQAAFLRQKKTLLESLLLQDKIDKHLYTKDLLTLIGDAHRGLPRLSDDPRIIWKRLNEQSQIRHSERIHCMLLHFKTKYTTSNTHACWYHQKENNHTLSVS
ncbi:uncharacterized protein C8orf48 homolog isoform X2 [Canis lupus baileyi]|uniref:uncharacterized protein C8orf48 homolog isoform X2 n=2 Tax=Canis lupus baileyi TaxID=143281 RepID=UPI003B971EA8